MSLYTWFVDSAAGLLTAHTGEYEDLRDMAEQRLAQMNAGDEIATKEILENHANPDWRFFGVIVSHRHEFDLCDNGNRDAKLLFDRMVAGDETAKQEILKNYTKPDWRFSKVIVLRCQEFDLRDPGKQWRDSNRVPLDVSESCTRSSNFGGLAS